MSTEKSERQFEENAVKLFNDWFDSLELYEESYTETLEALAAVVHSKKVQSLVNDMYLEHKGYDLEALEERGKEFLANAVEQAKANDQEEAGREKSELSEGLGVFAVIDKNARGGESIDSMWLNAYDAIERKEEINAYRVEEHEVNSKKQNT